MTHALHTERLCLRRPTVADTDAIISYYETERARFTGGFKGQFNAWKSTAALLGHWEMYGFGLWSVTEREADACIGLVGPFFPVGWPETEIGWMVFDGAEGKGYAQEAAVAAIGHARSQLGWTDIVHYIAPENERSIRLAERLGARLDPEATQPFPDAPCLVYRHPKSGDQA